MEGGSPGKWGGGCECPLGPGSSGLRLSQQGLLQRPLLTDLGIALAGKGKMFSGPEGLWGGPAPGTQPRAARGDLEREAGHGELAPVPVEPKAA